MLTEREIREKFAAVLILVRPENTVLIAELTRERDLLIGQIRLAACERIERSTMRMAGWKI